MILLLKFNFRLYFDNSYKKLNYLKKAILLLLLFKSIIKKVM